MSTLKKPSRQTNKTEAHSKNLSAFMKNDPPLKLLGFSGKEKGANKFCGKTWVSETSGLSGVDSWTRVKRGSPREASGA